MGTTAQARSHDGRAADASRTGRLRRLLRLRLRPFEPTGPLPALALAVLTVGGAVAAKLALGPVATMQRPFLLLNGAVMVAAWYGGARSALVAIGLSTAAVAYFFIPPPGFAVATPTDLWALALFVGESLLIAGLCESVREARGHAETTAARAVRELAERREAEVEARRMEAGLSILNRLGTALAAGLDPRQVATVVAEGAAAVTGAPISVVSFRRQDGPRAGEPVRAGVGAPELVAELAEEAERVAARLGPDRLLRHGDARCDERLAPLPMAGRRPVRSVVVVRLEAASGRGVLLIAHPQRAAFDETHERLMGLLGLQAATAIDAAHGSADLQQALQYAQTAGRMKDEFLSTLSHELRTPLNAIVGWAHLLQGSQLGPDDTHRAVATIVRNATLQENMIRELLDMSSLLNGRLRLSARATDLRKAVEEAVGTARTYAEARGLDLRLTVPAGPVPVSGDAARLRQVAWSLLSNAVKFTPAGGAVRVEVRAHGGAAEIIVADTGAGMEREFLARVFSRFSRADASSTRPTRGLGLGLSLARGLVELHGGDLRAESPGLGRGSTFTVRLPLLSPASADPDGSSGGRTDSTGKRVDTADAEEARVAPPGGMA